MKAPEAGAEPGRKGLTCRGLLSLLFPGSRHGPAQLMREGAWEEWGGDKGSADIPDLVQRVLSLGPERRESDKVSCRTGAQGTGMLPGGNDIGIGLPG